MSENSVGKISLDLEIHSDIAKQVSAVSSLIGKSLKTSLESSTSNAFSGMKKSMNSGINSLTSSIKSSCNKLGSSIKGTINSAFASIKNVKMPTVKFPTVRKMSTNTVQAPKTASQRGPPAIDMEVINSQIKSLEAILDNTNAKIGLQQQKLRQLKESYNSTFSDTKKNKIQEQIVKTEGTISGLIAKSDKLGFKLSDLDKKSAMATMGNAGTNNMNKFTNSFKTLYRTAKNTNKSLNASKSSLGIIVRSMFTWGIAFPMVLKGLQTMGKYLLDSLNTNQQFANSLAVVKTNLSVAFTPIFQAILPAITSLMNGLATLTTYIASFTSALFGKSYQASYQATQQLIDAKAAMGAYGDSANKAAKQLKGLAAFDEINTLNLNDDSAAGGGASKVPELTQPSVDTSLINTQMQELANRVKTILSTIFAPFKKAWDKYGGGVLEEFDKAVQGTMEILKRLFEILGSPPVQGFIQSVASVGLKLVEFALFIYNNYVLPLANWFIDLLTPAVGALLDGVSWLLDGFIAMIDWLMSDGKPVLDLIVTILGSLGAAFLIVQGALLIYNGVIAISTALSGAFGSVMLFVTSPIGIVTLAIAALIAIGVLLYNNWDWLCEQAGLIWGYIKDAFKEFDEWLTGVFTTDWTESFGAFGNILNGFFKTASNIWEAIKKIFGGIIDFVAGVFTGDWERAWQGVQDIFGGIMDGLIAVIKAPLNAIIGLINLAIDGLNSISVDIPDWLPDWAGGGQSFGINIPKIPYLARGGIIDSPTLAMVGEAGKEAVVPLENNTQGIQELANLLLTRMPEQRYSSNDSPTTLILKIGETEFARAVVRCLNDLGRQNGGIIPLNI